MGKGGFGKGGFGLPGFGKGWGKGPGPMWGKGWGKGPGPVAVAATVAGAAVTGAVVASVVARPAPPRRHRAKGAGKGAIVIVPDQRAPLNVTVALPCDGIEFCNGSRFYAIDVTTTDGTKRWRVTRCYKDFERLVERLGGDGGAFRHEAKHPGVPFPKKHNFGLSADMAQERRQGLQFWLNRVLENPLSQGPWSMPLQNFLDFHRHVQQPSAAPLERQPSVPRLERQDSEDDLILEIQVPSGVKAGQLLSVQVPGGQECSVEVPQGFHSGDTLQLLFDDTTQTLKPLL